MTINVKSEKEYVYRYLQCIGSIYGFVNREVEVATVYVCKVRELEKEGKLIKAKKKRDLYKPTEEVRKPAQLQSMCSELSMDFLVFRQYIRRLKEKGFFINKEINPSFLPNATTSKIEVCLKI